MTDLRRYTPGPVPSSLDRDRLARDNRHDPPIPPAPKRPDPPRDARLARPDAAPGLLIGSRCPVCQERPCSKAGRLCAPAAAGRSAGVRPRRAETPRSGPR